MARSPSTAIVAWMLTWPPTTAPVPLISAGIAVVGDHVLGRVGRGHGGDPERVHSADQGHDRRVHDAAFLHGLADLLEQLAVPDLDHEHGFSPFSSRYWHGTGLNPKRVGVRGGRGLGL
jgi:hypothetical protein